MPPATVWKIDGTQIDTTPQTIAGQLLATVPDLEYRSIEAMKDLFKGLLDLSIEMALIERETTKGAAQGTLTRHITATRKQIAHIPEDRERLLTALFDRILQCEGLGLLVGFSFGVGPRKNAERESTVAQLYEYKNKKENAMTKKKEDSEKKIKRSELIAAAKEMNRILAPDPEIEVNMPVNELTIVLLEAKTLLAPTDKVDPAVKKTLAKLSITALVPPKKEKKEAAEKAPPVEKEKEVPVVEKEPEKKAEPVAKKETQTKKKVTPVEIPSVEKAEPAAEKKETNTDLFIASVTETPGTMAEICKRPWNAKKGTFYNAAKQLIANGVLVRDEKTKVFSVK